jgi:hypothetical protein
MVQGIISSLKARSTFAQAVRLTTEEDAISMIEFWKNFNIRKAIENIYKSWKEVTASSMNCVQISCALVRK